MKPSTPRFVEEPARRRDCDHSACPLEQWEAEVRFESLDRLAERWLRHVQATGHLAEGFIDEAFYPDDRRSRGGPDAAEIADIRRDDFRVSSNPESISRFARCMAPMTVRRDRRWSY